MDVLDVTEELRGVAMALNVLAESTLSQRGEKSLLMMLGNVIEESIKKIEGADVNG